MIYSLLKYGLFALFCLCTTFRAFSQTQACPPNINFSSGALNNWSAYTGNNVNGNGSSAIQKRYPAGQAAPTGTDGAATIPEYNLPFVNGINVLTASSRDPFGGFSTIPTINGYAYNFSLLLGSTAVNSGGNGSRGGYIRGISYIINVPPGPVTEPYTITYAYAMVLENGSHTTTNQPMFTATVSSADSVFTCASAQYNLPTRFIGIGRNTRGGLDSLFEMDEAVARASGFSLSPIASPNNNGNGNENRFRVWTKGWTEVTFDLAAYRGKQVSLVFESDNCIPGGHFAYAYIAIRNLCEGLIISGPAEACVNTQTIYSIPALANASYTWEVPSGWAIVSGSNSNVLTVIPASSTGKVIAHEVNGCANLRDTLDVTIRPPTVAGNVSSNNQVCEGINSSPLILNGNVGDVLNWLSSDDGVNYTTVPGTTGLTSYTAQDLTTTTFYRTLVQNGSSCNIDTSTAAIIKVDKKSAAGKPDPLDMDFCLGQYKDATITINGKLGSVLNWQSSTNGTSWTNFMPAIDTSYDIPVSTVNSTQYRVIVKNGVCPSDTSSVSYVNVVNTPFPQATNGPADTTICYGDTAQLITTINIGTSYSWANTRDLINRGNGQVGETPYSFTTGARPLQTTRYVLRVVNAGCPNSLKDTFMIRVKERVLVNAGNDTSIVYNQPLQLKAISNYTSDISYAWTPILGLSNPAINNPIATLGISIDSVRYTVKVTDLLAGCFGTDDILVRVFKTLPDIFVPNAFTPGKSSNSLFRPIPVGIVSLDYFRVFNRWGQMVYNTTTIGAGWNGNLSGTPQASGSYIWMVQGRDYTGKIITRKGTMVLIR